MKRMITFTVCDGCWRNTHEHDIEIVQSEPKNASGIFNDETIDLCSDCAEKDLYICSFCREVHDDAQPCEAMILEQQRQKEEERADLRRAVERFEGNTV